MFAVLLLVLVYVSTASASLLPHREVPACERAAPQFDEFAFDMRLRDAIPRLGRCASTEMLMRPRMARGVVDANFHGKSELPNGRDQLEHIDDPTNDLQVDYAYDANGNREQRIVRQNNRSDARGVPGMLPFSNQLAVDPKFVRNTMHLVAANEPRSGFDSVSACQSATVCDQSIQEYFLPGAHSDVGGSNAPLELEGSFNIDKKRHGLDKFALALMWVEAKARGVPLSVPELSDRTGIDPYRLTDDQLRRFIHDSRALETGIVERITGRTSRTIDYGDGSSETLSAEELVKRWREQQGLSARVVEGANGQSAAVTE